MAFSFPKNFCKLFLYLLSFWGAHCFGSEPTTLYLTWQRNPESTMTINWITPLNDPIDSIKFRKNGEEGWQEAAGLHVPLPQNTPYWLHRIEIVGLEADSTYQFQITGSDKIYKFRTMPNDLDRPIRFVAGGDMYHDTLEILHATNQLAASTSPRFVLVGGDIAYASDKAIEFLPRWAHRYIDHFFGQTFDRWLTWLIAWKEDMVTPEGYLIPMLPAIGNHDTIGRYDQTPEKAPFFYSLFAMPGKPGYNVLDFGNYMSLFLLDTDHTNPIQGKQADWLASQLKQREIVPNKFALYHVPAYPSVHRFKQEIGAEIRKYWVPSFDAYHLTAAFENHEHAYKRTHPLTNHKISEHGVVYLGDGGWGVQHPRRPRHLREKGFLAKTASARHFIVVDIDHDKRTITAVDGAGHVIDHATLPQPAN
jgi:acid phosphatase type 7